MRIVIRPLEDVYETVITSATKLEAFMLCPKKFNEVPRVATPAMEFGTKLHEMMQHFLYNKEANYNITTELFIEREEDPLQRQQLSQMLDLAHAEVPETFMAEKMFEIEVECGLYLVIIRGKVDCFHSPTLELDDSYNSDLKTAASFWKEDQWKWKLQPYIYTWMWRASLGVFEGAKRFDYHIFKKLKRQCQYQHIKCDIDLKEAEDKIRRVVIKYITTYHAGVWKPKKNIFCRGCPLYKEDKCELYNPILARQSNNNESTSKV